MQNEKADCANEKKYRIKIFVHICHTIKSANKKFPTVRFYEENRMEKKDEETGFGDYGGRYGKQVRRTEAD